MTQWEWEGDEPTPEAVYESLASLDPVWGVRTVDYIAHVLPMMQVQTIYFDHDGRKTSKKYGVSDKNVPTWKLYMQVAGRLAMCTEAQQLHGWRVDFEPEPNTSAVPGMFGSNQILYREYVTIYAPRASVEQWLAVKNGVGEVVERQAEVYDVEYVLLGRKPGMAALKTGNYVPPYEKMETAARGRALGAWGFGVLPGSGIATSDEMELAAFADFQPNAAKEEELPAREEIIEQIEGEIVGYAEQRNRDVGTVLTWLQTLVYEKINVRCDIADETLDWEPLSAAQLELVRRQVIAHRQRHAREQRP